MDSRATRLLDQLLELPDAERFALLAVLRDSAEMSDAAGTDEAWTLEIKRRRERLRSGAATAVPWGDAKGRLSCL